MGGSTSWILPGLWVSQLQRISSVAQGIVKDMRAVPGLGLCRANFGGIQLRDVPEGGIIGFMGPLMKPLCWSKVPKTTIGISYLGPNT